MMNTIYIRTLKRAEHTVFCVEKGQKQYYDPQFDKWIPFSSGQQVKRSILESIGKYLKEQLSPITFISKVKKNTTKKKLEFDGEGEVFGTCNPKYFDQLFGGWMKAEKGGNKQVLKRRSPLSISAMRGLHPLLADTKAFSATFDRRERSNNIIIVKDSKGKELSSEEIDSFLSNSDSQVSLTSKYLKSKNTVASGLFVQDIAIDLRRLFCVSLNKLEPEITEETEKLLREDGWKETTTVFGQCLLAPKEIREKLIPALAYAIINWTITSNQSRTFSLMETLAVSISDNANKIAGSIRAKLKEEDNKAEPIIEESLKGVTSFVSLSAGGYIRTKKESADALDNAEQELINLMMAFDYEKQL